MTLLNKIGQVLTTDLTKDLKFKKTDTMQDKQSFAQQLQRRRSIYSLGKKVAIQLDEIESLIQEAVRSCPAPLNTHSFRIVILFNKSHQQFWHIVKEKQRQLVPSQVFAGIAMKIEQCAAAFGTVLFYEDSSVIQRLQKQIPLHAEYFPIWAEQSSGMAQYAVWTALANSGLGAHLQHYNPVVDQIVTQHFELPASWQLKAQLVFGSIEEEPKEKTDLNIHTCFKVFN